MKNQLIFDTTDAQSIADSDSVGAFVRSSDGTLITHSVVGSKKALDVAAALSDGSGNAITSTAGALDVNIKSPINVAVDLDGIYDVTNNPTPDNVGMIAHSRGATPGAADQVQRTTAAAASSDAVVAANVHALDVNAFGMAFNGTTWDRLKSDGSGNLKVNVQAGSITTSDAALANVAVANASNTLAVANTDQAAVASPLAARKYLFLQNNDNTKVFIGASGVTPANGFPIAPGSVIELRAGAAVALNFVGQSGKTPNIRTLELS